MPNVVAEDKSLVVREGNLDRLRVPSGILAGAQAQFDSGDGVAWQVQDFGAQGKLIVGTVIKGARNLEEFKRTPPTPPQRTAKAVLPAPAGATKKSAKKGGVAVALPPPPGLSGAVAVPVAAAQQTEDEDYLDDGPLPPAAPMAPVVARPVTPVPSGAVAPVPVPAKGGAKKSAKKGGVAYQVPGRAGLGSAFAE